MTPPARRRVVLLASTPAALDALAEAVAGRADLDVVARVTRVGDAVAAEADLVIAHPAVLSAMATPPAGPPAAAADAPRDDAVPVEALTPRELDVLGLLADGRGNRDIAATLAISEHTVKFHLASIFGKLGVSTRTAAVQQGLKRGAIRL